jgi:hypothetical protein
MGSMASSGPPVGVSSWSWMVHWFNMSNFNKVAMLYILVSLIILILIIISKLYKRIPGIIWVMALGLLGSMFFLYQAPDWRFGWAYLSIIPSLAVFFLIRKKIVVPLSSYLSGFFPITAIISLLLFLTILYKNDTEKGILSAIKSGKLNVPFENSILIPPRLVSFNCNTVSDSNEKCQKCTNLEIISDQVNDIMYVFPKASDQCWASRIPCSNSILSGMQLKNLNKGIASGFVKVSK